MIPHPTQKGISGVRSQTSSFQRTIGRPSSVIRRESGFSLVELLVAVTIMGVLVVGAITYYAAAYRSTTLGQDRTFCTQKAIQLVNELRGKTVGTNLSISLVPFDQVLEDSFGTILESRFSPVLSLQVSPDLATFPDAPASPISGNVRVGDRWKFQRQIDVRRFSYTQPSTAEEPLLVTVRCFYTDAFDPDKGGLPLAEITTVLRGLIQNVPTSQVFDLYVLAVDNVPGWWQTLSDLRSIVTGSISNLQAANPGLGYRVHWITRSAFGRDKSYTPFLNTAPNITTGTYDDIEPVYYYPGLLETTTNTAFWLYNPALLTQGKINPGTVVGGVGVPDSNVFTANPVTNAALRTSILNAGLLYDPLDPPNSATSVVDDDKYLAVRYALADYFNHAVRYPEELTEYCMRKFGSLPGRNPVNNLMECRPGNPPPGLPADFVNRYTEPSLEPSLRILLEQMYQNPLSYQNSLILNAHGNLLPVPPLRNYSDPAKNPTPAGTSTDPSVSGFPHIRVVTHPEQLEYQNGSNITLRVYSYVTNPESFAKRCDGTATQIAAGNPHKAILDKDCDPTTANTTNKEDEVPIVIRISGANFSSYDVTPGSGNLSVTRIMGEATSGYSSDVAPGDEAAAGAGNMWYEAQKWPPGPNTDLLVLLYNSPLRHEYCDSSGTPLCTMTIGPDRTGLRTARRADMYGIGYIPSPIGTAFPLPGSASDTNLTSTGQFDFKNTARWILKLTNSGNMLNNSQLTIETRIAPRRNPSESDTAYITRALAQGYDPANPYSYIPEGGLYVTGGSYNFVTANNVPSNVSRTYTWVSDMTCTTAGTNPCIAPAGTGSPSDPYRAGPSGMEGLDFPFNPYRAPFTERFQFMGDPRHNPYLDVKLDHRYNWYFKTISTSNGLSGFDQTGNGWSGRIPFDFPRFLEVYRMGILKSRSMYGNVTGRSFYYTDSGGAIGGDSGTNAWMSAYPLAEKNWIRVPETGFVNRSGEGNDNTYNNAYVNLDEIAGGHGGRTRTLRQFDANPPTSSAWYAKTWLGELYPDTLGGVDYYSSSPAGWQRRGNLPTNVFKMDTEKQTIPGLSNYNPSLSPEGEAPPSFFNNDAKYNYLSWSPSNNTFRTCQATDMASAFHFSLNDQILTTWPFKPNQNTTTPPEFSTTVYSASLMRTTVSLFSPLYYDSTTSCSTTSFPNQLGSALLQARLNPNGSSNPDADDQFGYFIMNGLDPANDPSLSADPNAFLTTFNTIALTYGFMLAGQPVHPVTKSTLPTNAQGVTYSGIHQLPQVIVTGPDPADIQALTNPTSLTVRWRVSWRRWDSQLYTPDYTSSFYESTPLYYVLMYSTNGTQWRYIIGDNDLIPPEDWWSRGALPKQDGGRYDPNVDPPNKKHYLCRGAGTSDCPGSMNNPVTFEEYIWNLSTLNPSLNLGATHNPPGQDYTIRVVAHRKEIYNHFAYHDLQITVRP